MVKRQDLLTYLNKLLEPENYKDIVPNGCQIEGKHSIQKIAFATSATTYVIEQAYHLNVDALFVHHGFFWPNEPVEITSNKKRKISLLLEKDISLFAYHLPLDALKDFGNNHPVLKELQCNDIIKFSDIGFCGSLPSPQITEEWFQDLDRYYSKQGIHINPSQKKTIQRICIISGNGTSYLTKIIQYNQEFSDQKIDAFVTGEGTEWTYGMCHDNSIAYSAMGHYQTEEVGVQQMAQLLKKKFSIETFFIKENNPF